MLGSSSIHLVFHLKHDGNEFRTILRCFTENKVALCAVRSIIVLLKISRREGSHTDLVELSQAMLLKAFSNHFC